MSCAPLLARDLPPVEGDSSQLRQVVMNLLMNATEAMRDRKGAVSISTGCIEADTVYLGEAYPPNDLPEGTYVYIDISDDGCGMPPEVRNNIFDPFFTTKTIGRGLGLAAVIGIVRGHKGVLKVDSTPEMGTNIRMLFPCLEKTAGRPTEAKRCASPHYMGVLILLADNEEAVRIVKMPSPVSLRPIAPPFLKNPILPPALSLKSGTCWASRIENRFFTPPLQKSRHPLEKIIFSLTLKEFTFSDDKDKKTVVKWIPQLKTAEKINGRLTISKSLPSPPQVLLRLLEACGNVRTTPGELAEIVFKDPSISAKILQLINSSFMGIRDKVNDLERAIVYLGADTIKNIAISASVVQTFSKAVSGARFNMNHFWWHSVMCGTLAKRIAGKTGYAAADEAFLSGMLHDIGKLVLWVNHKQKYTDALQEAGEDTDLLIEREMEIGASHHELGAWMVRQWRLNSLMADAIYYHHDELARVADALPLVKIVYLANLLSRSENRNEEKIRTAGQKLFDLNAEQIADILGGTRDEVADVAESLGIPATPPPSPVSHPAAEADALHERKLADTVKHLSLMYGTLQNLLRAHSPEDIIKTAGRGFAILFGIQRLLFFLHDADKNCLRAHSAPDFFGKDTAQSLVIPSSGSQSLLARCFGSGTPVDTFRRPGDLALSIADEQILRLLETEGILYLPMRTDSEQVGVIVVGVSRQQVREMENQRQFLDLFVDHTGMCLFVHGIRQAQERRLQAERLEASITMARKVVHEVNNPLGIIKNYLRILGLKLPEKHPAQAELGVISEEIDRVGQIVRSLKDYATPAAEIREKIDLNQLLKNILAIMDSSILKPAMIALDFTPDQALPKVRTEKNGIKQVIINLVKNAAEAMPENGSIHIATRYNGKADTEPEHGDATSDTVTILVKDTGPGLPEEIRRHLFEPFHSSGKKGHSGLGLSIVHNIIGRLGGNISCETSPQKGTVFIITLPITSDATTDSGGK